MSASAAPTAATTAPATIPTVAPGTLVGRARKRLTSRSATIFAALIALLWVLPTFGLFISSIRPANDIRTSGWWHFFTNPSVTLQNYREVLFSQRSGAGQLGDYFVNSIVLTVPSVLFPVALGALAAYAIAWMDFRGRDWIFVGIFALQIVPLQMALVPLLRLFSNLSQEGLGVGGMTLIPALNLEGPEKYATVWFAHTCFAMPVMIFLMHNFISELPRELMEAAKVDGAGHATIFRRIVMPLIVPILASMVIFQFLWVWNDLLVALIFAGGNEEVAPLTVRLAELAGTRGEEWQRLTAGAFVSMVIPLIVFLSLQRYFVRGLLAGGLKG